MFLRIFPKFSIPRKRRKPQKNKGKNVIKELEDMGSFHMRNLNNCKGGIKNETRN